jgi:hypothetical protein
MDSERFDRLVRSFGQTRSRRQTLRGLAAIAASGALALSGRAVSAQDCKGNGKACKKNSQCCSGNCGVGTGQGPLPGACAPACPALPACTDTCPCPSGSGQVCQGQRCCLPQGGTPSCGPDCCDSTLCCSNTAIAGPGVCTCL